MLAYGVKDLTTGEDICHKATRQQVADLIGAPVGRVPSMAKAGRLHDSRYLIHVEGELEDLVDEEFRERWDEVRKSVMNGLRKEQRRRNPILLDLLRRQVSPGRKTPISLSPANIKICNLLR